jgi:adenylosuccinate lyase
MSREDAYRVVQDKAMQVWAGDGDFRALMEADPEVGAHLAGDALAACFDLGYHVKHVDAIFARVFEEAAG